MIAIAYLLAFLALLMSGLLILRIKAPLGFIILFPKLAAGALSPLWFLLGLGGAILGFPGGAPLAVTATRVIHAKLVAAGVPAINIVYPGTTHGFDLLLPRLSPTAQSASYNVERFLALLQ